jgi:hypothetical protein
MRRGDSRAATRRFQALLDGWQRDQLYVTRDIIFAQYFAAENSYLQDQLAAAHAYQQAAHQLAQSLQDDDLMFLTQQMGKAYDAAAGTRAVDELPSADAFNRTITPNTLRLYVDLETRRLVAMGRHDAAWQVVEQSGLAFAHSAEDYPRAELISYLRAYIARGRDLEQISAFLATATAHFAGIGARLHQLQLLALTAWQQLQIYGPEAAAGTFAAATQLAEETGYVRVLMDIPALRR